MGIRVATIDDLDLVISMGKKFLEVSPYANIAVDEDIQKYATEFLSYPDPKKHIALLSDDQGIIGGKVEKFFWGKALRAYELMWWVEPEARAKGIGQELIEAFEYWAKQVGCKEIVMVGLDDRTCQFYEKNGYSLYERGYVKEL